MSDSLGNTEYGTRNTGVAELTVNSILPRLRRGALN
jgi:hypothetical protein